MLGCRPVAAVMLVADDFVLCGDCRNWSSCSRFSNSVAKFYSVPIPNEKPLDYLKVLELWTQQGLTNMPSEHAACRNGFGMHNVFPCFGCVQAMARIGAREHASLFVPVSIAQYSVYEALAAELMPPGCHNCTLSASDVRGCGTVQQCVLPSCRAAAVVLAWRWDPDVCCACAS